MRFMVLALDYDGTIAADDELNSEVRSAIRDLREQGVVVALVTGRILSDLQRVAGDLSFVDGIVAENGCVLAFPNERRTTLLGQRPSPNFLHQLRGRGIEALVGQCLVETDATRATEILSVIRSMELPLVPIFNRGRVMILPQGISKATGLRALLHQLRLSEHNAIGIGDAENDHAMLQACEMGVAVAWGSPSLQAAADDVVQGDGPSAVAPYLHSLGTSRRVPSPRSARCLFLGHATDGQAITLTIQGRNLLIVGDSCSGKSWVAGSLCEQLVQQGYSICVVDPEGDHRGLESLPGVVAYDGQTSAPGSPEIALALRHPDLSVVVDLSKLSAADKRAYVEALLPQIEALRRRTGLPHRVIVDEAHYFLNGPADSPLLEPELDGYTLITYRLRQLDPALRAAGPTVVVTQLTDPDEVQLVYEMSGHFGSYEDWLDLLGGLGPKEAVLLPIDAEAGFLSRFNLGRRLTEHVRHRAKYASIAVPERLAFAFTDRGQPTGQTAYTLRELAALVSEASHQVLDGHLKRGDLSRWIGEVFGDQKLAADIQTLETLQTYEALSDLQVAIVRLIEERYVLPDEPT